MRRRVRDLGLAILAAGVCLLAGCFGVSQNPSYFPYYLPTGDIIRTHAKPPGHGYYANFDPHAVRLEVRPLDATNPVRTQHVLIATVYDEKGQPRRDRRVEWMVEGVGNIVEVDESGYFPGRGYKVDNKYAVSYTNYGEHLISRGNASPADDFMVRPGQTWCVISSATEGDTYVTVYAPEIANWEAHRVVVTKHWVDAQWALPPPAVNPAGTEHTLVTNIFRHTDRQPLANYRVRYRILDGPDAVFAQTRTREAVATSDLSGNAVVTLAQVAPQAGINRIGIEIIRPPDPTSPSGVGLIIGSGETTKEWRAPQVALNVTGPPTAAVGQEVPYTITVTNSGQVVSQAMTVRAILPPGAQFVRSTPPATLETNQVIWTLGFLPPGGTHTIQALIRLNQPGTFRFCASLATVEGIRDDKCVDTQVGDGATPPPTPGPTPVPTPGPTPGQAGAPTAPPANVPGPGPVPAIGQLNLAMSDPATAVLNVPFTYELSLNNPGTAPIRNVLVHAVFDPALEHETRASAVDLTVPTLAPGQSTPVRLTLTPRKAGVFTTQVTATAEGGLKAEARRTVTILAPRVQIAKKGPRQRYVDQNITWEIRVDNPGDLPLTNVVVRDELPGEVSFVSASDLGQVVNGQVTWNLGGLPAKGQKTLQVVARCLRAAPTLLNRAVVTADGGLQEQAEAPLEVIGVPAYLLEILKEGDPVPVGGRVTYRIRVTNTGTQPANQVELTAVVPRQLQVVSQEGPTSARVANDRVVFPPLAAVQPKQTLVYTIVCQAAQPGDVRFRVELGAKTLTQPVVKEESTNIFVPPNGNGAAPPAPMPPPR